MVLAKIQHSIFLNAVPWKYSTYATWAIIIHSLLGLAGGSFFLFIFEVTGKNSNMSFLFLVGSLGLVLSFINIIGIGLALKIHKPIGQILLLSVYLLGSLFSAWLFVLVFMVTYFNIVGLLNPLGMLVVFFALSGWYTLILLCITLYKFLTKTKENICYACSRTYKVTDQFCDSCGRQLVTGLMKSDKEKGKLGKQLV